MPQPLTSHLCHKLAQDFLCGRHAYHLSQGAKLQVATLTTGIGLSGRWNETLYKKFPNKVIQAILVQSGVLSIKHCRRLSETTAVVPLATGTSLWKDGRALRDKASAAPFKEPGMYLHIKNSPHLAEKNDRHRMRCIALAILLWPELTMATTAVLSQRHRIVPLFRALPHSAT